MTNEDVLIALIVVATVVAIVPAALLGHTLGYGLMALIHEGRWRWYWG